MAPPLLSLDRVSVRARSDWLFEDLSLHITTRDRFAFIGRNGVGKSTLMRILAGTQEVDAGQVRFGSGVSVLHLEQEPPVARFPTLWDYILSEGMDARGYAMPPPARHDVQALADELALNLDQASTRASGGEVRRAALIRALAIKPSILLLDEPTNHLDVVAIDWLEQKLQEYPGAFLIISHDRTFLTRLTRSTLWLEQGTLLRQDIGFGGVDAWQEQVYSDWERAAEKFDTHLKQELHWLARGVTARRRRNQGRLSKLHEMRAARRTLPGGPAGTAKLALETDKHAGKLVIEATEISKSYGDRPIIKPFSLRVLRGDRIGIVGKNGAGKTTLLRLLTGDLSPDAGTVRRAQTLTMVSIDQQRVGLVPGQTVRDIVSGGSDWIDVRGVRKHVVGYMKEFLFHPKLLDAPIETLSGGERARILLAREFARPSSLLVLDEPTNDLDLETLDLLQEVIADFDGTVLIVSHDRDFLDRTVTVLLGLDGSGSVETVVGGYSDWQAQRSAKSPLRAHSKSTHTLPPAAQGAQAKATLTKPTKISYKDQRDYDLLPQDIAELDKKLAQIQAQLSDPALYMSDRTRFDHLNTQLAIVQLEKQEKEERWLCVAEKIDALHNA